MDDIGKHILRLRKQRKWALEKLGKATGLSVSFLSQVERGQTSISLASLKVIAEVLGEPIQHFFPLPKNVPSIVHAGKAQWIEFEDSAVRYGVLSNPYKERNFEPLLVEYPPGYEGPRLFSHAGEEFGYILKGVLRLTIKNKDYALKQGESFHFTSTLPHTERNEGDEPVLILYVVSPPIVGLNATHQP